MANSVAGADVGRAAMAVDLRSWREIREEYGRVNEVYRLGRIRSREIETEIEEAPLERVDALRASYEILVRGINALARRLLELSDEMLAARRRESQLMALDELSRR